MNHRAFGRLGWQVSELGYGMWGLADWTGSDDAESLESLQLAVDSGVNFFDTAWAYGDGHSERLLGRLLRENPERELFVATKIPPKNRVWPSKRGMALDEVFPSAYIREYAERSLENLGVPQIHLMQFHVWEDDWADDDRWQLAVSDLKHDGLVRAFGISVNRWEPWNGMKAIRSEMIDAVQVIYNIFDQAPEDELFPLCRERDVAVIARVPFDEGSLAGTLTAESTWPDDDWRSKYFTAENLIPTVERVERLKRAIPPDASLPEVALRFILSNPDVSTVIPGMRKTRNVRANVAAAEAGPLSQRTIEQLREHRWDRVPTSWSF